MTLQRTKGAGAEADKKAINAGEIYCIYLLQLEAERLGVTHRPTASVDLLAEFNLRISDDTVKQVFNKKQYKESYERVCAIITQGVATREPGMRFAFSFVGHEERALNHKGDLKLSFEDGREVPISLKNYTTTGAIQVFSGTGLSLLNNIFFEQRGVGMSVHPITNKRMKGGTRKNWTQLLDSISASAVVRSAYEYVDGVHRSMDWYRTNPDAAFWTEPVQARWKSDCVEFGRQMSQHIVNIFSELGEEATRNLIVKWSGMTTDVEHLWIWPDKVFFSYLTPDHQDNVRALSSSNISCIIGGTKDGNQLVIRLTDVNDQPLLIINIPFTYNKNGGWHCEDTPRYSKKDKMIIQPYQRRPQKVKEIATSFNTFVMVSTSQMITPLLINP